MIRILPLNINIYIYIYNHDFKIYIHDLVTYLWILPYTVMVVSIYPCAGSLAAQRNTPVLQVFPNATLVHHLPTPPRKEKEATTRTLRVYILS